MDGFVLITGISAAGKSTVAQLLAERLPRSVHVRGDMFRRFVISGREEMTPNASPEARAQLELRYRLGAHTGDAYAAAGFTSVVQDVVIGPWLERYLEFVRTRPLSVVVLNPDVETIAAREAGRDKTAYRDWNPQSLHAAFLAETPRVGLWLDTSAQSPAETVDAILARAQEALLRA